MTLREEFNKEIQIIEERYNKARKRLKIAAIIFLCIWVTITAMVVYSIVNI